MTSTRNKNTIGNYHLEEEQFRKINEHVNYIHSYNGPPHSVSIPSGGVAPPSRMNRDSLSENSIDIVVHGDDDEQEEATSLPTGGSAAAVASPLSDLDGFDGEPGDEAGGGGRAASDSHAADRLAQDTHCCTRYRAGG